jgi:hypothetical protein
MVTLDYSGEMDVSALPQHDVYSGYPLCSFPHPIELVLKEEF